MTYKPDFKTAYILANEILVSSNMLKEFPFKTKEVVSEISGIKCCSYKRAKQYQNLDIESFGSKSAVLIEQDSKRIIFYNETESKQRIRFSIIHEYGHDKLAHNLDTKDENLYKKYEVETNYFAAQLLMPEQLIRQIQLRGMKITKELLMDLFEVSEMAAEKRIITLNKKFVLTEEEKYFDDLIIQKYENWLNSKVPQGINFLNDFFDEERQRERELWKYNY